MYNLYSGDTYYTIGSRSKTNDICPRQCLENIRKLYNTAETVDNDAMHVKSLRTAKCRAVCSSCDIIKSKRRRI